MQVVRQSLYKGRKRINFDTLLALNNIDQCVIIPYRPEIFIGNTAAAAASFSFSLFLKPDKFSIPNFILATRDSASIINDGEFQLYFYSPTNELRLGFKANGTYSYGRVPIGEGILHLAFTREGSNGKLYVNGLEKVTFSIPETNFPDNQLDMVINGCRSERTNLGNNQVNHLALFNRALTSEEVSSIHKHGGILLEDELKKACVGHYIAVPGAPKMWDVVEIYNLIKDFYSYSFSYGTNFQGNDGFAPGSLISSGFRIPYQGTSINTYVLPNYREFELKISILLTYAIWRVKLYNDDTGVLYHQFDHTNEGSNQLKTFSFNIVGIKNLRIEIQSVGATQAGALMELRKLTITEQPYKAFHGQFVNFTPQELGIEIFSGQSVWKDLYSKGLLNNLLQNVRVYTTSSSMPTADVNEHTAFFRFHISDPNTTNTAFYVGQFQLFNLKRQDYSSGRIIILEVKNSDTGVSPHTIGFYKENSLSELVVKFTSTEINTELYVPGMAVQKQTISGNFIAFGSNFWRIPYGSFAKHLADQYTYLNHISMYNRLLDDNEVEQVRRNQMLNGAISFYNFGTLSSKGNVTIKDQAGNNDLTFNEADIWYTSLLSYWSNMFVETASLLPPLKNALRSRIDQKHYLTFSSTTTHNKTITFLLTFYTNGFTNETIFEATHIRITISNNVLVIREAPNLGGTWTEVRIPISENFNQLVFTQPPANDVLNGAKGKFYLNGRFFGEFGLAYQTSNNIRNISFANLTGYIATRNFDLGTGNQATFNGYILQFGQTELDLQYFQVVELWKNSQLANPSLKWSGITWQLWYDFNQIIDDTGVSGNYLIKQIGSNGDDAVLNNYTVNQATSSNKEYQVIPINTLRDNEIHHSFSGDTVNAMSEQVNLLDGTTAPTDTYLFEGALPTGLSLSASGTLTGTATQTGTFDLLIRLVDVSGNFEYKRVQIVIV